MHTNGSSDPRHKALVQLGTDEPELARALITMESRRNKEGSEADVVKVAKYVTSLMKKNKTAFKEQHHGRTSGSEVSEAVDVALESRKWEDAKQALQLAQDAIVNHAHDKIRYGVSASTQRNPMKKKLTRSAVIAQLSAVADVLELSAAAKAKPVKIVWEEQKSPTGGKGLFGSAFVTLRDQYGERSKTLNVRVDGRDPKNVRVDRGSMMGWEAIDGGRGFSTLAKGKAFATKWVQLAVEQGSEMPDVPKALLPISAAATEDGDAYLATVVSKGKTYKIGFFAESPSLAWDHATHATNDAMPGGKVTKVVRNDGMDPADMGEFISAATVSAAAPALEWVERVAETKTSGPVLGAETHITFKDKNTDMPKKVSVALRIDARDAKNVRVDQHDLTGWVAIDGGKGLSSVAKAKTYAKKWIAAVIEQGTVSPSISAAMVSADMVDFDQQPPPAGRVLGKTTSGKAIYEHPGKNSAETEKRYEGWAANDHNEAMRRFSAAYEKTNQPHLGKMSSFHMTAGQRGVQHPLAAKDAKVAYAAFKGYRDGLSASTVSAAVEQPKEGDLVYRRERGLFKLNDTVRGKVVKGKSGLMVRILSGSTVANMPLGKFVPLDDKWFTEEDFKKLHASTAKVSASDEPKVGTTWMSMDGERKIEKIEEREDKTDGSLHAWVSKQGSKSLQIIPMDQIAKHIKADEAAVAYTQKQKSAKVKEEEAAANTPVARFAKTLSPAMAAKATLTLEKGITMKNAAGKKEFFKTADLVTHLLGKGYVPHHTDAKGTEKEGWGFQLKDDPEVMKKYKLEKGHPNATTTVTLGKLPYLYGQWLLKNKVTP